MRSKGSMGVTLNWFAATIVIFFILLLFGVGVSLLAGQKGKFLSGDMEILGGGNSVAEKKFVSYLMSDIEIEGENMTVVDFFRLIKNESLKIDHMDYMKKKERIFFENEIDGGIYDIRASTIYWIRPGWDGVPIAPGFCNGNDKRDSLIQIAISKDSRAGLCLRRRG